MPFNNYKLNSQSPEATEQKPAQPATQSPDDRAVAVQDSLLAEFTEPQRDYIVDKLYPELKKALVHFISEAKRFNQIDEQAFPSSSGLLLSSAGPSSSVFNRSNTTGAQPQ